MKSIVPKIYDNIKIKVSKKESDKEKVLELMKSMKKNKVVETILIRPKPILVDRYGKYRFSKNEKIAWPADIPGFSLLVCDQILSYPDTHPL